MTDNKSGEILIIEDDKDINDLLATALSKAGYRTRQAWSGTEGELLLKLEREAYALVLLDLMLPGMTGEEVLEQIRQEQKKEMPVLILSAKVSVQDKVKLLRLGADDYITKPFSVEELLARIRVTQRRLTITQTDEQNKTSIFENGELKIDFMAGCTYLKGEELHLTPIEYKLLCILSRNVGKVLTHMYITQQIWGRCSDNDIASLRVFMATLRKKLEPEKNGVEYIQTHIGIGYRMLRIENNNIG